MVERLSYKQTVGGSSPFVPTFLFQIKKAKLTERKWVRSKAKKSYARKEAMKERKEISDYFNFSFLSKSK